MFLWFSEYTEEMPRRRRPSFCRICVKKDTLGEGGLAGLRLLGGSSRFAQAQNNVLRKLEVHNLLVRRFVTLRASANNVLRKLEVHNLLVRRFESASRNRWKTE